MAGTKSESDDTHVTPPTIRIANVYVYNYPPKYQSPAASSGPVCRICLEGEGKEDLVSPCRCTGTVGVVHKSCMETWLSMRCNPNDKCEICNYTFVTARYPKSLIEWIRSDENDATHRRSLMGDMTCFVLLTPLAIVSCFLCIEGAKRQVMWGNSLEAGCLMALSTFLITIYCVWNLLTVRYHLKGYYRWRSKNQNVKLLRVQRISTATESSSISPQVSPQGHASGDSPTVAIQISPEVRQPRDPGGPYGRTF